MTDAVMSADASTIAPAGPLAARGEASDAWPIGAKAVVYAATLYPFALCFANTHGLPITNSTLIGVEVALAVIAVPLALGRMTLPFTAVMFAVLANFSLLALMQSTTGWSSLPLNLKPIRDLLMPIAFVGLGFGCNSRSAAEKVLLVVSVAVVVLGLLEFVFPTFYYGLFDTLRFFAARGYGGQYALTVLQQRPEGIGRTLFPFLGPRRISSIFIEPVALGNFAIIVAAWGLSKPLAAWKSMLSFVGLAVAMIVMCDSRFASLLIIVLIGVSMTRLWRWRAFLEAMPLLAIAIIVAVALVKGSSSIGDNLTGRLQYSGSQLLAMSPTAWLGFPDSITLDAGYSYIIQQAGLCVCVLLWLVYSRLPLVDDRATHFHFNAGIYIVSILCVSGSSLFALKTSAVLWFLLGAAIRHAPASRDAASISRNPRADACDEAAA